MLVTEAVHEALQLAAELVATATWVARWLRAAGLAERNLRQAQLLGARISARGFARIATVAMTQFVEQAARGGRLDKCNRQPQCEGGHNESLHLPFLSCCSWQPHRLPAYVGRRHESVATLNVPHAYRIANPGDEMD